MAFNVLATAEARLGPIDQCKLVWVNATTLKLIPFNGNLIKIAGQIYQIPAAGITISNSSFGAAANALIYFYAYVSSGAVALGAWTTGHVTDTTAGNVGVEIMSGDNNKSLVGMAYSNSSGQFDSSATKRLVRSWFNDPGVQFFIGTGSSVSTPNQSWTELDAAVRVQVLGWAGEQFNADFTCMCSNSVAGNTTYLTPWVDGGVFGLYGFMHTAVAGYYTTITVPAGSIFGTDVVRTLSLAGQVGGGTGYFSNKIIGGATLGR